MELYVEVNMLEVNKNDQLAMLGCYQVGDATYFSIYATRAWAMLLEVYETENSSLPVARKLIYKNECHKENVFSAYFSGNKKVSTYVWRMVNEDYSYSPSILDPYAKKVVHFEGDWRNIIGDQLPYTVPKPHIPWKDTILYELHVGHFTYLDQSIAPSQRGTFSGLSHKLAYLKELGVTSIELLPIFKWNRATLKNRHTHTGELLEDVWGYNPISFFCIDERYSERKTSQGALAEFRQLVEKAHQLGLEVILDVVYNHTGEGGYDGFSFHFKTLAPEVYYKYDDMGQYLNCSGTGNTLNTNHQVVKDLIISSLVYWSSEIGVDGFRFDLASILGQDEKGRWLKHSLLHEIAEHPILSKVKLISESWDAKGSYDVGRMPLPFREWSDYFRDNMRKFVKGDQGIVEAISDCLMGKEIYFANPKKNNVHAIHFMTAHDGFTMWDLLSYNEKHNEVNGESNRDGHNANYSYNWGEEGETENQAILEARKRGMRNLMSLLLLSRGVPMLLMGDEIARTQKGNNNAFCQDDETVWVDWNMIKTFEENFLFTKKVIHLRKELDYFKQDNEDAYEISWHGIQYGKPDRSYYSRSIACHIQGKESLFMVANSYHDCLQFELPPTHDKWLCLIDTSFQKQPADEAIIDEKCYVVQPYSICLFKAIEANQQRISIENSEERA